MPIIKLKHVVSFSSEDTKHPAENLLKAETYFKWKCASGGERQVLAVLQLEKASKIQAIDIGNNGSAFIEILVGRSSWSPNKEFQVLLVASSFMTPAESKSYKELNRVRMFGKEHFTKTVVEEKWDLVKIVCTQPYNLTEAYGISFINIHSPPEAQQPVKKDQQEKTVQLGRFTLRSTSDDEEEDNTISTGSFFQRKFNNTPASFSPATSSKTMAAAVRDANVSVSTSTQRRSTESVKTASETSAKKVISVSEERRGAVAASLISSDHAEIKVFPKMKVPQKEKVKRRPVGDGTSVSRSPSNTPPLKKLKTKEETQRPPPNKTKRKRKHVPFNKILSGVVFGLSGYENPERGNVRDLALSMGAEYMPSWNNKCTHLICAFANTPKFQQVKGHGKIVKKDWIRECSKGKQRLPTFRFRMDGGGESSEHESDVSDCETNDQPPSSSETASGKNESLDKDRRQQNASISERVSPVTSGKNSPVDEDISVQKSSPVDEDISVRKSSPVDEDISVQKSSPVDEDISVRKSSPVDEDISIQKSSSECDTEDELEKLREQSVSEATQPNETKTSGVGENNADYNDTTEDEEEEKEEKGTVQKKMEESDEFWLPVPKLPNFFADKNFLIYGNIDVKDRRLLKRYITAYSGTLVDYMSSNVHYVISREDWDDNFEQAANENKGLIFLRPDWVFLCHKAQNLVDFKSFEILNKTV